MLKKIVLGALFFGLIGVLAAGTVVRTIDRTEIVAEARSRGPGRGQDYGDVGECTEDGLRQGYGQGNVEATGGPGRGLGRAGDSLADRQYPNLEDTPDVWLEYQGTVVQVPGDGVDLVVRTNDGQELTIGTGPMVMASQGFTLQAGEQVQVRGYWEDGEFKAAQVTRLADGQTITLRDQFGRPAWAGAGRNAQPEDAGVGQAGVEEWLAIQGTVVSVDTNTLVVQTASGEQLAVENRAWWFAQEQGFSTQVGNQVTLVGFYEGDDPSTGSGQRFEVSRIDDATNGQTVLVREENGRPLWAGRGRRGGL
jgi:RNase P/RNase MRP subunit p29